MRAQIVLALVLLKAESESRVQVKGLGGSRREGAGGAGEGRAVNRGCGALWGPRCGHRGPSPSSLDKYMEVSQHCLLEGQEATGGLRWHCFPVAVGKPQRVNLILLGCICVRSKKAIQMSENVLGQEVERHLTDVLPASGHLALDMSAAAGAEIK